ncbi:transmembrane protein, putative [Medicago truncatula]|nr:transmembrane protein, putative [Medicago truncatula]
MKLLKKLYHVQFLLLFNLISGSSTLHHHTNNCGNIKTQPPFLTSNSSISSQIRITVNVPTHVPEFCEGCENPNGNCNAGLKCLCHLKECNGHLQGWIHKVYWWCVFLFAFFHWYISLPHVCLSLTRSSKD